MNFAISEFKTSFELLEILSATVRLTTKPVVVVLRLALPLFLFVSLRLP